MVLDIILGVVLLAFGIASVYFSAESDLADAHFLIVLLIGVAAIVGGGYILVSRIALGMLLTKVAGIILAIVGFFLVINFPDITDYQKEGMTKTGVFIGLIMLILGVYLALFF